MIEGGEVMQFYGLIGNHNKIVMIPWVILFGHTRLPCNHNCFPADYSSVLQLKTFPP